MTSLFSQDHLTQDATQIEASWDPEDESQTPIAAATQPWATVVSLNKQFPLTLQLDKQNEVSFGRRSTSDVQINHPSVSGTHCCLRRDNETGDVFLCDLSTNGTTVNVFTKVGRNSRLKLCSGDQFDLLRTPECTVGYVIYLNEYDEHGKHNGMDPHNHPYLAMYDIREPPIGTGAQGSVHLAIHKQSGHRFAMKVIRKAAFINSSRSARKDTFRDEMKILHALNHKHIVKIYGCYETEKKIYLVLEYMQGGDLFDSVVGMGGRGFSETKACLHFLELVSALRYLHFKGVAHRDIKPENVLLSSKDSAACSAKLTDFGLARITSEEALLTTKCGTPAYLAPEVNSNTAKGYNQACDIYSLGVVLFIMLAGSMPYKGNPGEAAYERQVRAGILEFPQSDWQHVSHTGARDLLNQMICPDPKKRYNLEQILQHRWVRKWQPDLARLELKQNYKQLLLLSPKTPGSGKKRKAAQMSASTSSSSSTTTTTTEAPLLTTARGNNFAIPNNHQQRPP
jgi:serine/threonine protein kinase